MLLKIISIIFLALCISWVPAIAYIFIKYILCRLRTKDDAGILETKKERIIVYVMCFLLSIAYITMKEYWGTDTIGSFFSKSEFETRYCVHLFPEESDSKNYLVPADLYVKDNTISLEKVYWPNGGFTTFYDDGSTDSQDFYVEGKDGMHDDEGREWKVVLTKIKIKK